MQDILCFQRLTPALKGGACAACSVKWEIVLYHLAVFVQFLPGFEHRCVQYGISVDILYLTEALFFGTLIGNGDMHLKNFSAMRELEDDAWRLAPLYDMLSTEALRYEARLGLPLNRNAYASLTFDEIRMGCVSTERLEEIAARAEMLWPKLARAVLTDSERPGFHTAHSLIKRMESVVRRHVLEARRQPISFPQEREDIAEAAPDDIEPPFCFGR